MGGWRSLPGLLLVVAVSACAAPGEVTVRQVTGPSASVGGTPSPVGACPLAPGEPEPTSCVPYDGEAAMRGNDAYRQRVDLGPERTAAAQDDVVLIRDALERALATGPLDGEEIIELLAGEGFRGVQSYGSSDVGGGAAVGVSTQNGCIVGGVRGTTVDLRPAGAIADGGCLPAAGH